MFDLNLSTLVLQENPSNLFANNLLAKTNAAAHHDGKRRCFWGILFIGPCLNGANAGN